MSAVESPRTDPPVDPADGPGGGSCDDRADLDAIATGQGCSRTDLGPLLGYLPAATRQQMPGVLRQACARLHRLRSDVATQAPPAPDADRERATALTQARRALQQGPACSLEAAERAFGRVLARCDQDPAVSPDFAASAHAHMAALLAIRQQHRGAAEHYLQAAATPGLAPQAQWRYQHERAGVLEERGRAYADDGALQQAAELLEGVVLPLAMRTGHAQDWSATQHALGSVLGLLGQRGRGTRLLEQAVAAFENALRERSRETSPLAWAETQHAMGNALGVLGQREADDGRIRAAIAAFESALEVRSREQSPHDWAMTQYHLGAALLTLGRLTGDSAVLARAIDAYRQALTAWSAAQSPGEWAMTQNSLGAALRMRGEQGGDPRELEQAVAAYRAALSVSNRERAPEEWAMVQNNLGAALQRLGERVNDARFLREAVAAYGQALERLRRDEAPAAWAMTTANLGEARRRLAEGTRDAEAARSAVADFEAVAAVFHQASHPQYYELAKERLALARKLAAELEA